MSPSYFLTPAEELALEAAVRAGEIKCDTTLVIRDVCNTQLSVARHYGAIKINGRHYTYFPPGDELIRDDVLKWLTKLRKAAAKATKAEAKAAQGALL